VSGRHGFLASLGFAWDGLAEGAVRGRNVRIQLALGVLAGAFAARAPLGTPERALVVLCVALVVAAECANSAIEAVVDLATPGPDERARVAKDSAAAAVLALAAGSVLVAAAVAGGFEGLVRALAAGGAADLPGAGALAAAVAAGLLPSRRARAPLAAAVLAAAGIGGLVLLARGAESHAGTAAAALCLAVALGGAAKRRARGG
jgi:diacylglycerol kinase (ATP)